MQEKFCLAFSCYLCFFLYNYCVANIIWYLFKLLVPGARTRKVKGVWTKVQKSSKKAQLKTCSQNTFTSVRTYVSRQSLNGGLWVPSCRRFRFMFCCVLAHLDPSIYKQFSLKVNASLQFVGDQTQGEAES